MAAPVSWRIKGVNESTRRMASDAAARSGLSVGEWLERAIDNNAGVESEPLVSAKLLESARHKVIDAEIEEPDLAESGDQEADPIPLPPTSDEDGRPQLPLLSTNPKTHPRQVLNISPTLIAASSRRTPGNLPRILGGLLFVALIAGAYWIVDQNTKNKLAAETDAVASKSAATSSMADNEATEKVDDNQEQSQETTVPAQRAALTPLQKLIASANSGNAHAQHDLGLKYLQGYGVARDPKQGAQWLEQSANAGMPKAQYHIGLLYQKGLGVSSDMKTAFGWYQKAARQGHVRAQYNLGTLYAEGKGTERDYAEAARWFSRASREGLAEAHYSLGMIHENGLGVEPNQRKAAAHYRSALAAGSTHAAAKLTWLEPALKNLSASADRALLETDGTTAGPGAQQTPAKNRTLSAAGIKKLQTLLERLDLEPGPQDGLLGDRTIEAIKLYQRFAGLPVDGKPTLDLLLDLRQVAGAMSAEKPAASVPADVR